jgi:hypothetical protein
VAFPECFAGSSSPRQTRLTELTTEDLDFSFPFRPEADARDESGLALGKPTAGAGLALAFRR